MEIEKEIVAKGKTAARVTPERIQSVIRAEHYFTAFDGRSGALASGTYAGKEVPVAGDADLESLKLLTFCVLVLENGFIVTGESACASPENFDPEIGRKIARQNAVAKIWPLEGSFGVSCAISGTTAAWKPDRHPCIRRSATRCQTDCANAMPIMMTPSQHDARKIIGLRP